MKVLTARLVPTLIALIIALTLVFGVAPKAGADPVDPGQPDPTISATSDPTTPPDDATPPADDDVTPPVDDAATPPAEPITPPPSPTTNPPANLTPSATGYIPIPWDTSAINDGAYQPRLSRASILPSSYDLRLAHANYLTPVRNQGGWGTCWSFAASEAASAALVRNGVLTGNESPVTNRQISPLHLVQGTYYTNTFKADTIPKSPYNAYNQGGNDLMAAATWSHWYGAQTETAYPYPLDMTYTSSLPRVLSPAELNSSAYHLTSMFFLPSPYDSDGFYSSANVATIKQAVYTYGSVTMNYAGSLLTSEYYWTNGDNSSLYYPVPRASDHAGMVIGWDDNFAPSGFTHTPPGPGAFLIQNSWGLGNHDYFWLSYYDHTISSSAAYDMISAPTNTSYHSPYDWTGQYSYDSLGAFGGFSMTTNSVVFANKFQVSSDSYLRATQIVTQQPNMTYSVAVYTGAIASTSATTGGTAQVLTLSGAQSVTGTLTYAGYNTITFEKPVPLTKGQNFSIVVTLSAPAGTAAIISTEANFSFGAGFGNLTISPGESYVKSGSTWYDLTVLIKSMGSSSWMGNANIIGLTSPAPKFQLTFNANGGTVSTPSKYLAQKAKYGTLPTPTRAGYSFAGWYSAASGGSKVTSSTVLTAAADKTIYAHWTAKKYTAKFNANSGATPRLSGKKYVSKTVTFGKGYGSLPTTKRTGYSFAGWYTAKTGGTKVTTTTPVTTTGTRTLYAHWNPKTYTVKFNPNKGKLGIGDASSKPVVYATTYGPLLIPTRDGYVFTGWYTKTLGGKKITATSKVTITGTQTLYARWARAA